MKTKNLLLTFILLSQLAIGQNNSLEFFTDAYGAVPYSINTIRRPLNIIGINYQRRLLPKLHLLVGAGAMSRSYKDNCNNCADHFHGSLWLHQNRVSIGIRYLFRGDINYYRKTRKQNFDYYSEFHVYRHEVESTGNYGGGFGGQGLNNRNQFRGLGLTAKFGAIYKLHRQLYIGINLAFYVGRGENNHSSQSGFGNPRNAIEKETMISLPIEFRIGYRF